MESLSPRGFRIQSIHNHNTRARADLDCAVEVLAERIAAHKADGALAAATPTQVVVASV